MIVILLIWLAFVSARSQEIVLARSLSLPTLADEDEVKFYYLQGPAPYNLGANYSASVLSSGTFTHAGLGVWDVTTDRKFSIELIAPDGIERCFFPFADTSLSSESYLAWFNVGEIHVTEPVDEDAWDASRIVTVANGAVFNEMTNYVAKSMTGSGARQFLTMQPLSVAYSGDVQGVVDSTHVESLGTTLVSGRDSFSFVEDLMDYLATAGCTTAEFMEPYRTDVAYMTASSSSMSLVDLSRDRDTRVQVAEWFARLQACAKNKTTTSDRLQDFISALNSDCYSDDYVYVYRSELTVYNVTLTTSAHKLMAKRVYFKVHDSVRLVLLGRASAVDVTLYTLMLLSFLGVVAFFFYRKVTKKRRRVSFQGEVLAREAVIQNIILEQDKHKDEIIDYFYQEKKKDSWTFTRYFQRLLGQEPVQARGRTNSGSIARGSSESTPGVESQRGSEGEDRDSVITSPGNFFGDSATGTIKKPSKDHILRAASRRRSSPTSPSAKGARDVEMGEIKGNGVTEGEPEAELEPEVKPEPAVEPGGEGPDRARTGAEEAQNDYVTRSI